MTDFRENVIDILDAWAGYPILGEGAPSFNAGQVQVRCYINNVCPFYKTPKHEDALIFNNLTFEELKDFMPLDTLSVLTTTPGVEGLHFKPRKAFRHNYMYKWNPEAEFNTFILNNIMWDIILNDFESYFNDISIDGTTSVTGADKTRYKAEQSWFQWHSVFDNPDCEEANANECNGTSAWKYFNESVAGNAYTDRDILYDYQNEPGTGTSTTGYYNDYADSFEEDGISLKKKEVDGEIITEDLRIFRFNAQMPVQTRVIDNSAKGVHWKVWKRTPLFKGEDFFIRFRKLSQESVSYEIIKKPVKFTSDERYRPLDITEEETILIDPETEFERKINNAIRIPEKESEEKDKIGSTYEFFTQAYYIIELNIEYFIVIPERGNPTFIHFFQGENAEGVVSKMFGDPFTGISGEKLINSNWFDIVVRNHLGRLVIQFEGDFAEVPPWIVERNDWVVEGGVNGGESRMVEKPRDLIVPRGSLAIWGGNMRTGFLFGPLQYKTGYISFIYPPRELDQSADSEENHEAAFTEIDPSSVTYSSEYFKRNPIWLPLNGELDGHKTKHSLLFNALDRFIETGAVGDEMPEFTRVPLFTQDAQYYKNYTERQGDNEYKLGFFYYNRPIRDFSDEKGGGGNKPAHVKTSNIVAQKYKFLNDDKTRHQGFDIYVGMMAGDHVFTDQFWISGSPSPIPASQDTVKNDTSNLDDSNWFLADCKTPIMTSLRLVSSPSEDPRWDDGTSTAEGMRRDPGEFLGSTSPYFIDASEHVMSFQHSWSSSSLTTMEHSGTIQFYLNRSMNVDEGNNETNATDLLLGLQDKTFYIEVWGGYKLLPHGDASRVNPHNYTRIPGFYKMFTGICEGGTISYEYGKNIMTCRLEDYTVVLKGMKFFNSPWFDGLKDVVAVNEILQLSGFRDQGPYDPGSLIKNLASDAINLNPNLFHVHFDGRVFKYRLYALPSGYNRLEQPALKFNEGDPFIDAITKISTMSSKMFYFDEFGIAHFEDFQDMVEEDFQGGVQLIPLYQFTMNPETVGGQVIFNRVERSFDVASVVNHIKILTNTPDMHILIRDHIKWDTMENPEMTGFIGYKKTLYQAESMFGSAEAQISTINKYAVAFKPKVNVRFETYGLPLRATDIVSVEGEVVRVIKVDHTLDASKNQWWMQVECEKYQAIDASSLVG